MTTNGSNGNGGSGGALAAAAPLVLVGAQSGVTLIPSPTPLTRLNYFDGKFLRADDLSREQAYLRRLVELSNQAGGSGVVHGFDLLREGSGGALTLTAGLAVDPRGRVLFLPHEAGLDLQEVIERSRQASSSTFSPVLGAPGFAECETAAAGGETVAGAEASDLYLIVIAHAEALCGEEDVYGKLCEDACVGSTQRPYRLEGVVVRAIPLALPTPPCTASWLTAKHRRSQAASAYFARERALLGRNLSAQRLRSEVWCRGAVAETGEAVPIAVVSTTGGSIHFIDPWIARRERFQTPPPRWWMWQTRMRPDAVFWAQVLQFQCHLRDLLDGGAETGGGDPCAEQTALLGEVRDLLQQLQQQGATGLPAAVVTALGGLGEKVGTVLAAAPANSSRVLIDLGITELPSAGYLPVDPQSALDVNDQVRRLMGEGVELRFCVVRPDFVAHALEEAQHLDRICLLSGLDDPERRETVDVLVPDGELVQAPGLAAGGLPLEVRARLQTPRFDEETPDDVTPETTLVLTGAGRAEVLPAGGGAFHFAGRGFRFELPESSFQPSTGFIGQRAAQPGTSTFTDAVSRRARSAPRGSSAADTSAGTPADASAQASDDASAEALRDAAAAMRAGGAGGTPGSASGETPGDAAARSGGSAGGTRGRGGKKRPGGKGGGVEGFQSTLPPPPPPQQLAVQAAGVPPSAWASVRIERDPFSLQVGDAVGVRGEFALSFRQRDDDGEGEHDTAAWLLLQGDLEVAQATGGTQLQGMARGYAFVNDGGGGGTSTDTVEAQVQLSLQGTAAAGSVTVAVALEETRLSVTTAWSGDPVFATADARADWIEMYRLRLIDQGQTAAQAQQAAQALEGRHPDFRAVPVGLVTARESAESAQPGNAHHDAAVQALTTLGVLLDEPGFRAEREALLFPPPAPPQGGQARIRAVRDWVLFHRRRETSCCGCEGAPAAPVVVAAPPRRYRLYHLRAQAQATVEQIRAAVQGSTPVPGMETVGVVPEFRGNGSFVLQTPNADVASSWGVLAKGTRIVYGAVAGAGAGTADSAAVHDGRLERIAEVVDDATPDENAVYDVLAAAPPHLSAAGADGVMVLVTQDAEVRTTCIEVLGVVDSSVDEVSSAASTGGLQPLLGRFTRLGSITFEGQTPQPDSLRVVVDAWSAAHPEVQGGTSAVILPQNAPAAEEARARQHAQAVLAQTGGTLFDGSIRTAEPVVGDCGALLVIQPAQAAIATVCNSFFVTFGDVATLQRHLDAIAQGQLAVLQQQGAARGAVSFQAGTATRLTTNAELAQMLGQGNFVRAFAAVVPASASAAQRGVAAQQSRAIIQAVAQQSGGAVELAPTGSPVTLPGSCPAITLAAIDTP